jgi:hypothetical protein
MEYLGYTREELYEVVCNQLSFPWLRNHLYLRGYTKLYRGRLQEYLSGKRSTKSADGILLAIADIVRRYLMNKSNSQVRVSVPLPPPFSRNVIVDRPTPKSRALCYWVNPYGEEVPLTTEERAAIRDYIKDF